MSRPATRFTIAALLAGFAATPLAASAAGGEVEVLHFWTRGAEAGAIGKLKETLRSEGHTWKEFAVADGGGGLAMVLLNSRVTSGNPPTAAQIKGVHIQEWAHTGRLSNIEDVARAEKWDTLLPKVVSETMKYQGYYVAAPLNVHRVNWLWINPQVLKKARAKVPTTWEEFFATADAIKQIGVTPLAYGGRSWLDLGTFESVAIGVGGAEFYKRAFIKLEPSALSSPQMEKTLQTFRRLKQYTVSNATSGDWVGATALLNAGQAGMLLMGDWAKAEMLAAGKKPGIDLLCVAAPGTADSFSFDIDSLAMFQVSPANKQAQRDLASDVMSKEFQISFNLTKGSIPVRLDISMERFDECAKRASADFKSSAKRGTLLPSLAHGMAQPSQIVAPMWEVISQFWNQDKMTAQDAMARLAAAARAPNTRAE